MSYRVLSRWGVICVQGEDAAQFLHTQLSNSIKDLPENKVRLAAFCNAKGRILGTFLIVRRGEQYFLICPSNTIASLSKRLGMFILRSKCKAVDASQLWRLRFVQAVEGLIGSTHPMSAQWGQDGACILALRPHNGGTPGLVLSPVNEASLEDTPPLSSEDDQFELALQQLGIAFVSAETVEMFIPQAINFDLVGGVNFEKGCYPGQEIVARSHYLGKSKRRAFGAVLTGGEAIRAGMDVWLAGKTNEPIGNVITAVHIGGHTHLMVDCSLEEAQNPESEFTINTSDKTLIFRLNNPPYDVREKGSQFND